MAEYIEREAVEKYIENGLNNPNRDKAFGHDAIEIMAEVHYMPAADVAPVRRGRWVHDGQRVNGGVDWYHCSECLHPEAGIYAKRPFCSMCGAKMDLEDTECKES